MSLQDIYKIRSEMKKSHKRFNLLMRKRDSFGLTENEKKELSDLQSLSYILHEELIEAHINISVMPFISTPEYNKALKAIQTIVPWSGGLVRRDEDIDNLIEVTLTQEQRNFISKKLEFMHLTILQGFELFCSTESGNEHMVNVSKVITMDEEGNVLDLLAYLDARYREFAEVFDIELEDVEILWDEVDSNEKTEKDS